ncbi:MAG: hypothetical protein MUF23_00480 [Pirellula sp.]|jgi:hypothetical protein|nr:hypothetical protein [Pirellula sp.]
MNRERDSDRNQEAKAVWKLSAYVFGVVLISVLLLAINAGMVFGLASVLEARYQTVPLIEQISQYSIYVFPIILLYFEWYAWDVLSSTRRRRQA